MPCLTFLNVHQSGFGLCFGDYFCVKKSSHAGHSVRVTPVGGGHGAQDVARRAQEAERQRMEAEAALRQQAREQAAALQAHQLAQQQAAAAAAQQQQQMQVRTFSPLPAPSHAPAKPDRLAGGVGRHG